MATGTYLSEAFVRVSANADPAQFRDATDKAIRGGLAGLSPTVPVTLGTDKAKADAAALREQLRATFDKITATVKLDDADARLKFARLAASADRLQRKLSSEKITLDGVDKARLDLLSLQVQADRLGKSLGGVSAGAASSGSSALSNVPLLGGIIDNPAAAGAAAGIVAVMAPIIAQGISTAITLGAGAGIAGIAILGASKTALVQQAFASLKAQAGKSLLEIGGTFAHVMDGLLYTAQGTLSTLTPVFKAAAKTISGPFQQFGSALISAFAQPQVKTAIQEIAAGFGALLKTATPELALTIRDIARDIGGIAQQISKNPVELKAFLAWLTAVANLALGAIKYLTIAANWVEQHWRKMGDALIKPFADAAKPVSKFGTDTAAVISRAEADLKGIWSRVQADLINPVRTGAADVTGLFERLPGDAEHALASLGGGLRRIGSGAMSDLLSGLEGPARTVLGWLEGFAHGVIGLIKKILGVHSPSSVFYAIGKSLMQGLANGVRDHVGSAAAAIGGAGGTVAAAGSGLIAREQEYAAGLLGSHGWGQDQMAPLIALWNRESGWNADAVNPSSGAYGIPQALGHGHPYSLGDWKAQIIWGEDYIAGRYGSPAAAWSHEMAAGWYAGGTSGAAPGWAVVGEKGPELVRMHGGEHVLPAHVTSRVISGHLALPGYAAGAGPVHVPVFPAPASPPAPAADQAAAAQSAAAIAAWAAGIMPGITPASAIRLSTGGTAGSPWIASGGGGWRPWGGGGPPAAAPAGAVTARLDALAARLDTLIAVTRAAPGQNTAGMQAVMGGMVRTARQSARYRTR